VVGDLEPQPGERVAHDRMQVIPVGAQEVGERALLDGGRGFLGVELGESLLVLGLQAPAPLAHPYDGRHLVGVLIAPVGFPRWEEVGMNLGKYRADEPVQRRRLASEVGKEQQGAAPVWSKHTGLGLAGLVEQQRGDPR
jgi:hypothetical protein